MKKKWTKHNLNDAVRVKLTDKGYAHMLKKKPWMLRDHDVREPFKFDELWVFMDIFGDVMGGMQGHEYMDINILIEKK